MCFLRGKNWIFKLDSYNFVLKGLNRAVVYLSSHQMELVSSLPSPLFLPLLPCLSLFVPVIDFDPECRPTVTKFRSHSASKSMTGAKSERPGRNGRKKGEGRSDTRTIWREEKHVRHYTKSAHAMIFYLSFLFSASLM